MKRRFKYDDEVTVKVNGQMVSALYDSWSDKYNMPLVNYNGKILPRKIYETKVARKIADPTPVKQSRFDVNRRFDFIRDLVNMVITGSSKSVIISGSGGLGKTWTVMECLNASHLQDVDDFEENEGADELGLGNERMGDYTIVKGFSTPKALYRLLWNNKDRIVVFDDCDSIWDNPTSVSLLKCALDSYETRRIHWLSEIRDEDDLPQSFEFTGKIIFVSNLSLADLEQAVLSRCLYVDVTMTSSEKIERIRAISGNIRTDMAEDEKAECLELLEDKRDEVGDLNIRTFLKVLEIRDAHRAPECPVCHSKNVSTPDPVGKVDKVLFKCLEPVCGKEFKRDRAFGAWRDMAEYVVTAF